LDANLSCTILAGQSISQSLQAANAEQSHVSAKTKAGAPALRPWLTIIMSTVWQIGNTICMDT
jgi:hypothetical protein